MVSVIIPARNEAYLEKTISSVLAAAEGEVEVLVMLDGYLPSPQIVTNDPRVRFIHYPESIGQRRCINAGARIAKGKYIMKLDAHCALDKGFDVKLAADCEYDWTVIPRMYNLDIETWMPKLHKRTDYMYISSPDDKDKPFRAMYYGRQPESPALIDDIMCCMGPCFFMHKDRFWELGGCDEGHGGWGQQGIEVSLKAWLSGGSLKVNKKTWFAHWFRGDIGFPYPIKGSDQAKAREYSQGIWLNNKWDKQKRTLQWVVNKFNPPGWDIAPLGLQSIFYKKFHLSGRDPMSWRGVKMVKLPTDLAIYHQAIWQNKPDFIVECGTRFGGSALFFADMLDIVGKGKVITIDKFPDKRIKHDPRIVYLQGGSTSDDILAGVKEIVGNGSVMVVLDSDHSRVHVKRELHRYASIVTQGQCVVIEDCFDRDDKLTGPGEARDWFLKRNKSFKRIDIDKPFLVAFSKGGWLTKL